MKATTFGIPTPGRFWVAVLIGLMLPLLASADHRHVRSRVIRGDAVTGINDFCGSPLYSLPVPPPLPQLLRATNIGEYNPNGDLPIPLKSDNCRDEIVLATSTDTEFLEVAGIPDVDSRIKNIPLHQNFVITNLDGSRSQLPTIDEVPGNALPPTRSNPNRPITLGRWLSARGVLHATCKGNGKNTVVARFTNLIPNGVYTMWGIWTTTPPGATDPQIVPVPLGGVPNAVVPDGHGNATFVRELASCPLDVTEDGSILMFVTLAYHSDSDLHGTVPEVEKALFTINPANGDPFVTTFAAGVVSHDHVTFLISGDRL